MEKEQFETLAMELADTMYRVSSGLLRRPQDRHDAMQSCLLKAWQARHRLRDPARFRPWLLRILINECHTLLRKNRRLVYTDIPEQPHHMPDSSLHDAVMALPERYRLAVLLHYVEGASVAETALALGIPEGTVKSRLSQARRRLREALGEEAMP